MPGRLKRALLHGTKRPGSACPMQALHKFIKALSGSISRDTAILSLRYPVSRTCDTPFCNISRDSCAIPPPPPPQKQVRNSFAILSLQVSRDMKSMNTGPLSQGQILAVWILAATLLNSELNYAVDFGRA